MFSRQRLASVCGVIGVLAVAGAGTTASAQPGGPPCAAIAVDPAHGVVGNPTVLSSAASVVTQAQPFPGGPFLAVPPFCQVDLVISEREGPAFGYAVGERQNVTIRIGLPLNTTDGGTGGSSGQGAWNGKVRNVGGGRNQGSVISIPFINAVLARYVSSITDGGHALNDVAYGVIQATNELNVGKIDDFYADSLRIQYQWALRLTARYYGRPADRNYFDGCATGGRQSLVVAQKYGADFDGFLVAAPFAEQSRTASAIGWRVWLNLYETGGTINAAKTNATAQRVIAACDQQDGIADGMLSNPRTCKASAALNVCGQPGAAAAPACVTPTEASVIDAAMDGARNDLGHKVWLSNGRGSAPGLAPVGPPSSSGFFGIWGWANKDMNYTAGGSRPITDWDDLHQLTTTVVGPHFDLHAPEFDLVRNSGAKILMWHGLADPDMPWQQNAYFYDKVLDHYGGEANVTPWFRFFTAPGVNHCGGGIGPQPQQIFDRLVDWVEGGIVPDTILSSGPIPGQPGLTRTRPLCPYPTLAIWDGVGDINAASSYSCGGSMHTMESRCEQLVVEYQKETGSKYESVGGVTAVSCGIQAAPVTTATLSPSAVNGWYRKPTVTLAATDRDGDVDRTEYRLDGAAGWTPYTGPFRVLGDGDHVLEFRSIDKAENAEAPQTLAIKIDATAPAISGLPPAPCTIWPPNRQMVPVASVTVAEGGSGVAPGTFSIAVTSNEPLDPSDVVVDGGRVTLRATRLGQGNGRTYRIKVAVSDLAGNTTMVGAMCTVPHDQGN
jgi:hypothetical protein